MAQGIFAGGSGYDDQSLEDIEQDIKVWIGFCEDTLDFFDKTILELHEKKYYETIPFNLRALFDNTKRKLATFIRDFNAILKSISEDTIFNRDVALLKNIGTISIEHNDKYGTVYHEELSRWYGEKYSDPNFRQMERLYAEGRDLFGTLMDASNAAERLKDYMSNQHQKKQTINITGTGHQIAIGDNNKLVMKLKSDLGEENAKELSRLMSVFEENLDKYFKESELEKKETAEHLIGGLREEVTKENPKRGIVGSYLHTLNGLSTSADFITIVSGITTLIGSLPFMK